MHNAVSVDIFFYRVIGTQLKVINRTILVLSCISLFTDIASEMLYPILPMYLTSIGFSVVIIGILEGVAEATAGISKGFFGNLSDTLGKRTPFIQIGYSLSAVSKPMMAFWTFPLWVFIARTLDRLGKGIRTGARDALLSAETTSEYKGRVFGFHRAFDTLGAALGPLIALVFLSFFPGDYRTLFFLAFFPGIFAIILTMTIHDKPFLSNQTVKICPGFFSFLHYWKNAPQRYRRLVLGLLAFALINSSDVLLLLMMRYHGASDQSVIGIYIFYNLVYALSSYPLGALGDRLGLKKMFIFGLSMFLIVYGGIIYVHSIGLLLGLFFLYGLYAAATEGISKAWIATIITESQLGTAIGFYTGFQSLCTLVASSIAGWLWYAFNPTMPFGISAIGTFLVILYFIFL